jgi:hypothetical protein
VTLNPVPFVSVDTIMRLVPRFGVDRVMVDLAAEIDADFLRRDRFDKTPRVARHSEMGVIELMPTSDGETFGFKYVNGHPAKTKSGLQTGTAFSLLADVATGYPLLLSEMTILTALHTAAPSVLAARHADPDDPRDLFGLILRAGKRRGPKAGSAKAPESGDSAAEPDWTGATEDPKANVQWTFAGFDCRRAQARRQGAIHAPDACKSGRACLGGRGTRLPRGRQARADLTRVKSAKKYKTQQIDDDAIRMQALAQ